MGDRRFTPIARIYHTPEEPRGLYLRGIYFGSEAQARESLATFQSLGLSSFFQEMTFLQAIRIVEDGYPPYERFTTGGRFALTPFSSQDSRRIVSLIDDLANGSIGGFVSLYGLGGAVSELCPNETAFYYRGALNIITLSTNWEDPAAKPANLAWFTPRYKILRDITCGSYVNFPNLENQDYMHAYYGCNADRLSEIKARTDPENLFCFPQSIR
ncbi:putative FAD-linked oxidoreductase YvdP [bioreactor metagenome]|uniref:Putative FAD-linked oxidoreductase YvdP n=1 Tax=bioreactor metagenome TaxID=1076179 RepID=A0A644Y1H6_9ZZZZ